MNAYLADWQRIRRYTVPQRMITECAEARERGDWRAACDAARFDVAFDPELAEEAAQQAAHFAPDLLRWHLPRVLFGSTNLLNARRYLLIPDEPVGPRTVLLTVQAPPFVNGSQRLTLGTVRGAAELRGGRAIPVPAYLWDVRHAHGLRAALGGTHDRLPLFTPAGDPLPEELAGAGDDPPARAERAWQAPRIARGLAAAGMEVRSRGDGWSRHNHVTHDLDPVRLVHDARWFAARFTEPTWAVYGSSYTHMKILTDTEPMQISWVDTHLERTDPDRLPPGLHADMLRNSADLKLVHGGKLPPGALHPLVRAALFPGASPAPPEPGTFDGGEPVRVRCRGDWHEIEVRLGRLDPLAHTPEERQRERAMRAFGGAGIGCFEVENIWYGAPGRLPRRLRAYRADLWQRLIHGGTRLLVELLDAGLDPHLRDSAGGTLFHQLPAFDHRLLLPRLLAAGVDINVRDRAGLTALHRVVVEYGSADVIIALVDAGADVSVPDRDGETAFIRAGQALKSRGGLRDDYRQALQHLHDRAR
ncbi:hypothetical protein Ait01nite_076110 [Actinoplanes italicus]|uniref:Ankyrin repeat protein n=1 Tax=Actinoplanes italicus TaxID=113567 RepID=A0A2T0JYX1_9ACTN|nr:ankyrin repeat domain-containing protein [Actinoplanes italicus]PRX14701.1 ankyrin repeat protein [Actinoplanes italicus]GIE34566.1 hypothetical protein Ait01nite_076110 [Actinoplanes italicus]